MLSLFDIMSIEPGAISSECLVEHAAARLARRPGQPLVVVDGGGRLCGVLQERDMLRAPEPSATCASLASAQPLALDAGTPLILVLREHFQDADQIVVAMTGKRPVGTLSALDVARIAQHVLPHHLKVAELELDDDFVVLDAELSPATMLRELAAAQAERVVIRRRSLPVAVVDRDELAWARRIGTDRVAHVLGRIAFPATGSTSLRRVAHDMLRSRSRHLPVLDRKGELEGVVGLHHVIGAVRAGLEALPASAVA